MGAERKIVQNDVCFRGKRQDQKQIKVQNLFNSVHTRCIVKTSGFTRGVCKNLGFY